MSEKSTNYSGGIGFVGLLTIVFITLKLLGVITWSWWWVLSPIWISWLVVIFFIVLFVFLACWAECSTGTRLRKYGRRK